MKKLLVLHIGLIAILGFLYINNYITYVTFGTAIYPILILVCITMIGLGLIFFSRYDDAKWISNHMTRFGMIGTIIGMVQGLTGLHFTTTDVSEMATQLAQHTGYAFYSTLFGVLGNIWLNLCLRIRDNKS